MLKIVFCHIDKRHYQWLVDRILTHNLSLVLSACQGTPIAQWLHSHSCYWRGI